MRKIFVYMSLAAAVMLTGCTKFLDTLPDNRTDITTVKQVSELLVNAYPEVSYNIMLEARSDGYKDFGTTFEGMQPEGDEAVKASFHWQEYDDLYKIDTYQAYWEQSYLAIAYSNFALQALENHKMTGDNAEKAKAEARISRAYHHFMILSMFSNMFTADKANALGIPYVEEPEDELFKQYERGTVRSTLDKIEKDLFEEIDNIGGPADYLQPKFHFTVNSANAFATRYKLFTEGYNDVIKYANRIIGSPSKFYVNGTNDIDGSDKVFIDTSDITYVGIGNDMNNWQKYEAFGTNIEASGRAFSDPEVPGNYLVAQVQTVGMRFTFGTAYTRYGYPSQVVSEMVQNTPMGERYALSLLEFPGAACAFWMKFYEDFRVNNAAAGTGAPFNKNILFRLEEVLLNRAEAYVMTGKYQEAINDLNMFVQKKVKDFDPTKHSLTKDNIYNFYKSRVESEANFLNQPYNSGKLLPVDQTEGKLQRALILAILDMRRVEFLYEGMRFFDLLRWKMPIAHTTYDGRRIALEVDDPRRILQIPEGTAVSGLEPNDMQNKLRNNRKELNLDRMKSSLRKIDLDTLPELNLPEE